MVVNFSVLNPHFTYCVCDLLFNIQLWQTNIFDHHLSSTACLGVIPLVDTATPWLLFSSLPADFFAGQKNPYPYLLASPTPHLYYYGMYSSRACAFSVLQEQWWFPSFSGRWGSSLKFWTIFAWFSITLAQHNESPLRECILRTDRTLLGL